MFAIRVSSVFLLGALLVRVTLFVADDSRLLDLKSLVAIERRISRLIDEALRHRSEERERHETAERIGSAARHAVRRSVIRVVASSTIGTAVGEWARGALTLPIRALAAIRSMRKPLFNRLTRSAA